MTPRLTRHYLVMWLPQLAVRSLKKIFTSILGGFLSLSCDHLQVDINSVAVSLTDASVDVFNSCRQSLLPTPAKSHYTFNLRDLSRVYEGLLRSTGNTIGAPADFLRLWRNEVGVLVLAACDSSVSRCICVGTASSGAHSLH